MRLLNLKQLKKTFESELTTLYPKTEIESFFYILMETFFNLKRIDIALNSELEIKVPLKFHKAVNDLVNQKPIQYIIGETEFYGLPFKVNKDVLIPRPETEELVHWIITNCNFNTRFKILDIGTGTGCIAISLAKKILNSEIYALDVSKKALEVAKVNAKINNVNIVFIEQDILNTQNFENTVKFDVIVSNPPYIRNLEKKEINANVLNNEPHLALFVTDENPLLFYDAIANFALKNLIKNGKLYFEINQYLGRETIDLLTVKGFKNIVLQKDIFKNDRMLYCEI
ncbi:MAG: peptide chain release factor N(5)-glutamine methyltransferase [Flavobacteriaceae bacterium]|nr:peptide chain release factor N(5)-glutamine methyltransferase [Flavobacteriaceae bacterium]